MDTLPVHHARSLSWCHRSCLHIWQGVSCPLFIEWTWTQGWTPYLYTMHAPWVGVTELVFIWERVCVLSTLHRVNLNSNVVTLPVHHAGSLSWCQGSYLHMRERERVSYPLFIEWTWTQSGHLTCTPCRFPELVSGILSSYERERVCVLSTLHRVNLNSNVVTLPVHHAGSLSWCQGSYLHMRERERVSYPLFIEWTWTQSGHLTCTPLQVPWVGVRDLIFIWERERECRIHSS